jgi:hypothetical protein
MRKTKIDEIGLKLAQKCGRWSIIDDNIYFNKKDHHYHVKVQCECGTKLLLRVDFFKNKKSTGCRHCVNHIDYPSNRKSRIRYYNGLNYTFLSRLGYKYNLNRGSKRILKVDLTIEDLYNKLIEQKFKCALSNQDLYVLNLADINKSNASIDRIDSNGNYTFGNIQWVHKDVNRIKNSLPQDYFIKLCRLISDKYLYDNSEPS